MVGPNGSGKSTLLNIITNLLTADCGNVTVLGKNNRNPDIFKEIAFMQDNSVLYEYLTGYDHLQFIGDVQGISKKQITDTAERIGISGYLNKKVGNYSFGMKQHLLLAMAVLNAPKLLILDEPLNGLDPTSAIRVRELLVELHKAGTTILLSSHNLAEIDQVTSTILFLKNGELIKENILQHENFCYEFLVNDIVVAQKRLEEATIPVEIFGDKLRIYMEGSFLDKVFRVFVQREIKLLDLEKKVLGTEERYQKIFGKKSEVE